MEKEDRVSPLASRGGHEWMAWLGKASGLLPELSRALQFLASACELIDDQGVDHRIKVRKLRQITTRFLGQARCPSSQSCEKIAMRTQVIEGWMHSELVRGTEAALILDIGAQALQRLLSVCEGADDKHGVLLRSVRDLSKSWLLAVAEHVPNAVERAHLLYPVAMLDQSGMVDPSWWWKQIAQCERHTVLGLIELEVREMSEMQPSNAVTWRSFDKRWRRIRLRALLEHLGDKVLLAELLRKSAVDDFEAVQAVKALREAGRARDAIVQAEQWLRALPRSPVLAEALFQLYQEDGWDEDALALAIAHYEFDPNPAWFDRLNKLGTQAALQQLEKWKLVELATHNQSKSS